MAELRLALMVATAAACRGGDAAERPDVDASFVADLDARPTDAAVGAAPDAPIDARSAGGFRTVGSLAQPRNHHAVALLNDGRVLVVGGEVGGAPGGAWTTSAEVFDPATETFRTVGSTAFVHLDPTATTLADGRVLVTGPAQVPGGLAPKTELFDPATDTFAPGPDMLRFQWEHTPTRLADGRVLYTSETNEAYDPAANTFQPMPPLNVLGPGHEAVRLADHRVLLSGGPHQGSSGGGTRDDAEEFDPATATFSPSGSMATPRSAHQLTLLADGRVLATGGYIGLGGEVEVFASAECYDPATRTFASAGLMTTSREHHTATTLVDGRVLITGGVSDGLGTAPDNDFEVVASAELYDPATRRFTATPPMHVRRTGHTATCLPDGRVLVIGGSSVHGGSSTAAAEIYDP